MVPRENKANQYFRELFIVPRRPFTVALKLTLFSWIVNLIKLKWTDGEQIRVHDIRAHATPTPMEDIIKVTTWKNPSTCQLLLLD